MSDAAPVYEISLPEYKIEPESDWLAIGRKIDHVIETHFTGKRIAVRGIGLIDHPGRSVDDLVSIILELGTDRYDLDREGLYYPDPPLAADMHAAPYVVSSGVQSLRQKEQHLLDLPDYSAMGRVVRIFYNGALADRGYSIRLDILLIYDLDQLEPVPAGQTDHCQYSFKDPNRKREALLGVIKLLRGCDER